jgi:hydroxymethylbilane synthase
MEDIRSGGVKPAKPTYTDPGRRRFGSGSGYGSRMPETVLRLGTRRSPLARAQSRQVAEALTSRHPGWRVELVGITTRGDREPGDLKRLGGKGLFTEELERGLFDGSLDLAVHSLKDLPVHSAEGLRIAAFPRRGDPRDALVSEADGLETLPAKATVLTGSLRRQALLLSRRPDLRVEGVRGNVETRLRKWREGGHGGVVLAMAGLERLGLVGELPVHPLDPDAFPPAPGQGTLAVQVRCGRRAEALCRVLNDADAAGAAAAERRVVEAFGGDCNLPLGAWARREAGGWRLTAVIATPDGRRLARAEATGDDPAAVAAAAVEELRAAGADGIVRELSG